MATRAPRVRAGSRWRWRGAGGSCRAPSPRGGRAGCSSCPACGRRPGRRRRRSGSRRRRRTSRRCSGVWTGVAGAFAGAAPWSGASARGLRSAWWPSTRACAGCASTTKVMTDPPPDEVGHELLEEGAVVVVDEVAVELVRGGDLEAIAVQAARPERREPALEEVGAEAGAQVRLDPRPELLGRHGRSPWTRAADGHGEFPPMYRRRNTTPGRRRSPAATRAVG